MINALACFLALATSPTSLPDDSAYVTVSNGRLTAGAQRVRLWCVIGGFPNYSGIEAGDDAATRLKKRDRAYRAADLLIERFAGLGFNGMRLWEKPSGEYVQGDGSRSDVLDYFVASAKKKGFRIWLPAVSVAPIRVEDFSLAGKPETADAWQEAVKEGRDSVWLARIWDDRLEAAQVRHMQGLTNHVNRYTGLRWGDDPVFAIWELTNEEWWMMKMVGGQWLGLPKYFRDSLTEKWHEFLTKKYASEAGLMRSWGFLMPGESLAKGTVQIAPLAAGVEQEIGGMDPQARIQVEASRAAGKQKWTRDDFNRARAADVLEFFVQLQVSHKKRLQTALKGMGKSARLGPTVFDTGIGYEIQSQYMHQHADAVSHNAYINGVTQVKENQRYPWYSGLEEWPRIAQDVPWLEHNKVEGKPFLCYETQIMQPAKFRAEYPMRLLALAAIQDWDAICWHYWGSVPHIADEPLPFDRPMDMTTGWHPQGYHYTYDSLQNAVMRAAGYAFRSGALDPASKPTRFTYGRRSLYDPASMDYGGSYGKIGLRMLPTTYTHGVRIKIDPTREEDAVEGPTIDPLAQALPSRLRPTPQIEFAVDQGLLRMDSPNAAGIVGFTANAGPQVRFKNGIVLNDLKIHVPNGMPHAEGIVEERYLAFLLTSQDGLPLTKTRRATLSLKSTSFNSGFELLLKPDALATAGTLPVLEARVSASIQGKALAGMRYRLLDWHFREIGSGTVGANGVLRLPANRPIWVVDLRR
jgi:hypothetical protein